MKVSFLSTLYDGNFSAGSNVAYTAIGGDVILADEATSPWAEDDLVAVYVCIRSGSIR